MRYLSVCSGIEAATVAWHPLGWRPVAFSEIEPFPCAVLAHHYPTVPNWGDMTRFHAWPDTTVDLLVGGTPCQSFSVAGLRAGLADPRGSLLLTYLAIAGHYRPRWLVWENVPGVLSADGGRAFGSLLGGLAELGYGFAYRVLDAQYFGLAQRRARVFVVGHLGDWRRAAAVLFERESLSGHPAPRREAEETVAHTLGDCSNGGGGLGTDVDINGGLIHCANIAPTLNAHFGEKQGLEDQHALNGAGLFIAHSLPASQASEDGTGRGTLLVPVMVRDVAATLGQRMRGQDNACADNLVPVAFHNRQDPDVSGPVTHPLGAKDNGMAVAYTTKLHNTKSNQAGKVYAEYTTALDKSSPPPALLTPMAVRRLTPRECERLQGFPDDYTLIPYRKKPAADVPRYKALGNSMAVPVMAWIGRRIQLVDAIPPQECP